MELSFSQSNNRDYSHHSICFVLPLSSSVPQNVTANHRVNDAVFTEDGAQMVTGRFMYGPLDMVTLTGEKVMASTSCDAP